MKRQYQAALAGSGALIVISAIAVPAYAQGMRWTGSNGMRGNGNEVKTNTIVNSTNYSKSQLSTNEIKTLQHMIEEEKLAHDIYAKLYEKWGVSIFGNISKSETMHQSMVATAAAYYNVGDTRTDSIGTFTDTSLQSLYDQLLTKGLSSLYNAYEVGKSIEELDIADLQNAITETNSAYLDSVYGRLLSGSQNHLKAFSSKIT